MVQSSIFFYTLEIPRSKQYISFPPSLSRVICPHSSTQDERLRCVSGEIEGIDEFSLLIIDDISGGRIKWSDRPDVRVRVALLDLTPVMLRKDRQGGPREWKCVRKAQLLSRSLFFV